VTRRIRFLVAVRPGFISLGLFAQMAAAFHHISGGRLDINIVPGGIQHDFERLGEMSDHRTRYQRAEEFIVACRKLWREPGPVTFLGEHYRLEAACCSPAPEGQPPRFYLGGVSQSAMELSARQADVHLSWIEPLESTAVRLAALRREFQRAGRTPVLGLRTHLVVRDTEREAWDAAEELVRHADPAVKAQRRSAIEGTPMVGQQAQAREALAHRLAPHLWNGLSEVRVNCGTAVVGTPRRWLRSCWPTGRWVWTSLSFPDFPTWKNAGGSPARWCRWSKSASPPPPDRKPGWTARDVCRPRGSGLAEVALPRALFWGVLERIGRLCPAPGYGRRLLWVKDGAAGGGVPCDIGSGVSQWTEMTMRRALTGRLWRKLYQVSRKLTLDRVKADGILGRCIQVPPKGWGQPKWEIPA